MDQLSASKATAAIMVHRNLSTEAGMASASAAAQQAKLKLQKKHQQELLEAALTPPQQRTNAQIEQLCDFLSTVHLLRSLQPTALKSLAHAMTGQYAPAGDVIYKQGEPARHLFVVLSGEVVIYEQDASPEPQDPAAAAAAADGFSTHIRAASAAGGAAASSSGRGSSSSGLRAGSSAGATRSQQSPRHHHRAASPSAHKPGSPRRLGSSAGHHHPSSSTAGAAAATGSAGSEGPTHSEVRRVKPREAFGEDEVTAHGRREQTAVSSGASRHTFGGGVKGSSAGSGSSSSSTGGLAPSAGSSTGLSDSQQAAAAAAAAAPAVAVVPAVLPSGVAATAAADSRSQCVLLVLSAEDYGAALEGRLTGLLEEKVTFLASLPAFKGLHSQYLRALSHCFHQVNFEPREVVVRQGDVSDCMFVLKSGQVCILIDPTLTLAETGAAEGGSEIGGRTGAARHNASSSGGAAEPPAAGELDTKKLVQVCLLGGGAIIGDMSVRESAGGPPRRSATVVALTELVTYKVPLKEFKRRMPADVLEGMRQVANQKLEMNDKKAQGRALANGHDGQVLLGGLALPECVLQGKGLRALLDAQQQVAPVGGLIQALELSCHSSGNTCRSKTSAPTGGSSSSPRQAPGQKWFLSGSKAAADVEGFMDSLSRSGFLAAPPNEFLALMTDWRSARANSHAQPQQVPPDYLFPLPLPGKHHSSPSAAASASALAAANSHLHPAHGTLASLTHAAPSSWSDPAVTTHTVCVSRPHTPSAQQEQQRVCSPAQSPRWQAGGGFVDQPLMTSPTSLLAALSLDQYAQPPPGSPGASRHTLRPTTPAGLQLQASGSGSGSKGLSAAAVAREAAQQLMGGGALSPKTTSRVAGGMGGRGTLLRGALAEQGACGSLEPAAKVASHRAGSQHSGGTEPTLAEAAIKASALFRPGSPICIGRCGSPRPQQTCGSDRVAAAASRASVSPAPVVEGLSPGVHAAVVTSSSTGKQQLTFHT